MLNGLIRFLMVLITVLFLYLVENFVHSRLPGYNRSYLLQPLYRLIRLFGKQEPKDSGLYRWFPVVSCFFALCALWLVGTGGHLIPVFLCLAMMEMFLLAGGWNPREALSAMAAQRGVVRFSICAFICLVSAAALYRASGTLSLKLLFEYSETHFMLLRLPLIFTAMLIVLMCRANLMFFDFNITGKGLSLIDSALHTPYSGFGLAFVQITQWVEIGVWIKLISVFLPFRPYISFAISAALHLVFLLLDGFISRVQWKKVARNALIWGGGLSVMNFVWLYLL